MYRSRIFGNHFTILVINRSTLCLVHLFANTFVLLLQQHSSFRFSRILDREKSYDQDKKEQAEYNKQYRRSYVSIFFILFIFSQQP